MAEQVIMWKSKDGTICKTEIEADQADAFFDALEYLRKYFAPPTEPEDFLNMICDRQAQPIFRRLLDTSIAIQNL